MFYFNDLKRSLDNKSKGGVLDCPVKNCSGIVKKPTRESVKHEGYPLCPKSDTHPSEIKIRISPSTYIYENPYDNIIWKDDENKAFFNSINQPGVKRVQDKWGHNKSEDAVSFNVFRFLDKHGKTGGCLSAITGLPIGRGDLIYWSYSKSTPNPFDFFVNQAIYEFGEKPARFSEPDLVYVTEDMIILIESKFTSEVKTPKKDVPEGYSRNCWQEETFSTPFETIAKNFYELSRFWLLGSWWAKCKNKSFLLLLILNDTVHNQRDDKIFTDSIIQSSGQREYQKTYWQNIRDYIGGLQGIPQADKTKIMEYFENKAVYKNNTLQKAF